MRGLLLVGLMWFSIVAFAQEYVLTEMDIVNRTPIVGERARILSTDGDTVNMRDQPSRDGQVVARLSFNTMVTIIGESVPADDLIWWQVRTDDGQEGYVVEALPGDAEPFRVIAPLCPFAEDRLAFGMFLGEDNSDSSLFTSARDGSEVCDLLGFSPFIKIADLAWSGDGSTLVFSADLLQSNGYQVWAIDPNGDNLRQITQSDGDKSEVSVNDNGSLIAFTRTAPDQRFSQVWLINGDGTNPRTVTDSIGGSYNPLWSPDGTLLFFVERGEGRQLNLWDADTRTTRTLAPIEVLSQSADLFAWSPDSQQLAFYEWMKDEPFGVVQVVEGIVERYPSSFDGKPASIESVSWSPDGQQIAIAGGSLFDIVDANTLESIASSTPATESRDHVQVRWLDATSAIVRVDSFERSRSEYTLLDTTTGVQSNLFFTRYTALGHMVEVQP